MSTVQAERPAQKAKATITEHRYFSKVPEAAVFTHIDGHAYARIPHKFDGIRIVENLQNPRMVRADGPMCFTQDGVAYVWFATLGSALAQKQFLPFGADVQVVERNQ